MGKNTKLIATHNETCVVFCYIKDIGSAIPAGRLSYNKKENKYIFKYNENYLENKDAIPVDRFNLPLSIGDTTVIFDYDKLGVIRDSAPEYWGRLVIARELKLDDLNEIDVLLTHNPMRVGNLDFQTVPCKPESKVSLPLHSQLSDLLDISESIEQNIKLTTDQERLLPVLRQGSSIGGARPKTILWDEENLWLAKFPSIYDKWSNAKIEKSTMQLSALCGINIPEIKIEKINGKDVFFIKRFDADIQKDKIIRHEYFSGLTLLNVAESEVNKFSYQILANNMRKYNMVNDMEQLLRRIIFNILVRNFDDHPRNHGFLGDGHSLSLSPAFDITPTTSLEGVTKYCSMAMNIGAKGKIGSLDNLLSECGTYNINQDECRTLFYNIQKIVADNWRRIFSENNVTIEDSNNFSYTFSRLENKDYFNEQDEQCYQRPSFGCF